MSETTIQMARGGESGDYHTYDAATVAGTQVAKGFALIGSAAEQVGEFIEARVSEGDDLVLEKWTGATGRYATESGAVRHIYLDPSVLDEYGGGENDDGDYEPPETLGFEVAPSTEDAFEQSQETPEDTEDEADSLLADADSDAVEVEDTSDEDEAEELLAEMEEAE